MRVLVMTWASGGNLPPLLAAASLLDRRGHEVTVLGSGETRAAARRLGLDVTGYQRGPDPDAHVAFEAQAELMMATMAGSEIALDARDALAELRPDLAVVDCMLPAAIAAARATGTPAASLVHFLYGLARTQMFRTGGGWTTDLRTLAATHGMLGLTIATDGLSAWEAPDLVLVSAPRWLDIDCDAPANVLHAEPARTAAAALAASVHETIRLAKAYAAERATQDQLVASVPGASPRADGPAPSHPWEAPLRDLARAVAEMPELPPPPPRWFGVKERWTQDRTARRLQLLRIKKRSAEQQAELDKLKAEVACMAKKSNPLANLPNLNPKLIDWLRQPGPSAKPPVAGHIPSGGLPRDKRGK